MPKIVFREVQDSLYGALQSAANQAKERGELSFEQLPDFSLEVPKDKNHGNFAANLALVLAKEAKTAPRNVAQTLIANLPSNLYIKEVEVAGPGFINFYLNRNWLVEVLRSMIDQGEQCGNSADMAGLNVQIEFVSANPVGPMNVVNARAAALGDSLGNLMQACGASVWREYYVNDYGVQVETLGRSLDARYRELLGETVDFPEDGYQGTYLYDLAQRLIDEKGRSYLELPETERITLFKDTGCRWLLAEQRRDLANYGVNYDQWFSERTLHESGAVQAALDQMVARDLTYNQDNALWLRTTAFGDDKDRVLKTADGRTTYFTADIAYHLNKFQRGFNLVIDIWGPDHHGYIPRMKAALIASGIDPRNFEVLIAQQINLLKEGKPFKMSKRRGEFITMADLLQEVGNDAARWFFLMRSPDSHLDFDLDLAKSETSENPVFYVQYAYARICSIFRQATPEQQRFNWDQSPANHWDELEEGLLEKAAHFPDLVSEAARRREPHALTGYLLELASLFHSYYNKRRFIDDNLEVTRARLALAKGLSHILKQGLNLLGVSAPEKM